MSNTTRGYFSESRQANAEQTRKRILDAARALFLAKGFEKTSITQIADSAGVSAASVYALYKSKEGLLRELIHATIFGEQYLTLVDRVITSNDPLESLRTAASITRLVCEAETTHLSFVRGAAILSPALKMLEQEGEQIRYERQEVLVHRLFDAAVVHKWLDFAHARDILWALTSRDLYRLMVVERNWSPDEYEEWLTSMLLKALINDEAIADKKASAP